MSLFFLLDLALRFIWKWRLNLAVRTVQGLFASRFHIISGPNKKVPAPSTPAICCHGQRGHGSGFVCFKIFLKRRGSLADGILCTAHVIYCTRGSKDTVQGLFISRFHMIRSPAKIPQCVGSTPFIGCRMLQVLFKKKGDIQKCVCSMHAILCHRTRDTFWGSFASRFMYKRRGLLADKPASFWRKFSFMWKLWSPWNSRII